MHRLHLLFGLFLAAPSLTAQESVRYFQRVADGIEESVAIWVSEEAAGGIEFSGSQDAHSAFGTLMATVRPDGIVHATWNYEIEGSQQSEEQLLKIEGNTLFIGEGELEEHGPGQLVLKDPGSVVFKRALEEIPMLETTVQSEEAKSYATGLNEIIGKLAEGKVELEGDLRVSGGWLRFTGFVRAAEGATLGATFTERQDQGFQIFLEEDGNGGWTLVRHGFTDNQGYYEFVEALPEFEAAPWPLEEELLP